jgi:hypothetical protein
MEPAYCQLNKNCSLLMESKLGAKGNMMQDHLQILFTGHENFSRGRIDLNIIFNVFGD